MKTADVNTEIIGKRCKCMFAGIMVTGIIRDIADSEYSAGVKVDFDEPHQWGDELYQYTWSWGRKMDDFGPLHYLEPLPEPLNPAYETLIVTFPEPISTLERHIFDDPIAWGAATLKEWVDSYEGTRFTQTDECTAVITSEDNMYHVREWLQKHTEIETCKIF